MRLFEVIKERNLSDDIAHHLNISGRHLRNRILATKRNKQYHGARPFSDAEIFRLKYLATSILNEDLTKLSS